MEVFVTALMLGIVGSFHCVGMCGPLAMAVPSLYPGVNGRLFGALLYNGGRILTYSILGFLFGMFGKGLVLAGFQQYLSIAMGVSMLLLLYVPYIGAKHNSLSAWFAPLVGRLKSRMATALKKQRVASLFVFGLLNGLLPCGLVYAAVAGAIAQGNAVQGSVFMVVFGLGTFPAMFAVTFSSQVISSSSRAKVQRVIPVVVTAVALLLILRGLNLGVPYLSPELSKTDCTKHTCCHRSN